MIDTHQHLWDLAQFPYSWCAGIPKLNRSFTLEEYRTAAQGTGITKTVFMECDVDEPHAFDEAAHIDALARSEPSIAGLVASGRPERDGFPAYLERLITLPKLRGLRRVLHTQPDALSQSSLFRDNVRRIGRHGLTFDVCVLARQLPVGLELIDACPDVSFVLDHCGVPDVKAQALDPWRQHIAALAERPNVACKISGIVAYADAEKWTVADLRPFVEHVIASFGWNRIVWGGDWPVCTLSATLSQWVEATRQLVSSASDDERAALFHRNAERIYRV